MLNSTRIAGLLGPTLIALAVTEWANLEVFISAMGPSYGPHVYQNGTLLFVGGLSIVRAHNHWSHKWPVLITLVGWFALLAGLGRMSAPLAAQAAGESSAFLYGSLVILLVIGLILSFKSYVRPEV
jgi:hypothetical protein